jgi:K+ transporter
MHEHAAEPQHAAGRNSVWRLVLGSIGVVYGDI